jgi:hypothetical protein
MVKNTMSLIEAFKVRNLIKSKANKLSNLYFESQKRFQIDLGPDYSNTYNRKPMDLKMAYVGAALVLEDFNVAINAANFKSGAQELILRINTAKDVIMFLENVLRDAKSVKRIETRINQVSGAQEHTKYDSDLPSAQDIAVELENVQNAKFEFENKLAVANATHNVEITDELKGAIESVLAETLG